MIHIDNYYAQNCAVFQTFHSRVWEYLKTVRSKPARLFGLYYLDVLEAVHRGETITVPMPKDQAQRQVKKELDHIYKEHYEKADVSAPGDSQDHSSH
jgi:hypothetical protein